MGRVMAFLTHSGITSEFISHCITWGRGAWPELHSRPNKSYYCCIRGGGRGWLRGRTYADQEIKQPTGLSKICPHCIRALFGCPMFPLWAALFSLCGPLFDIDVSTFEVDKVQQKA